MTRLLKTTNKQHAEEKAAYFRAGLRPGMYHDEIIIREFPDGSGQIWYEVWLNHKKDPTHKG